MWITAWFKQAYDTFTTPFGRQLSTFILTSQKLDAIAAYKACWMISLMHFVVFQTKSCMFFCVANKLFLYGCIPAPNIEFMTQMCHFIEMLHWTYVCVVWFFFPIIDKYKTTVRNSCLANWENESTRKCISE